MVKVSLYEAQVMDYLLKKIQYRNLLKGLTKDKIYELKWVIYYKNNLLKVDFVDLKDGLLVQKNYLGAYEYDRMTYYESQYPILSQVWSVFCKKYFLEYSIGQFGNLDELSILFEMLYTTVKEMDIQIEDAFLRPILKNVIFIEQSSCLDFIYLDYIEEIDIVSLTCNNGGV